MQAHEHFAAGEQNLKSAEHAMEPARFIGLAHGHFLAAQTLILAAQYEASELSTRDERVRWAKNRMQQYSPDGRPMR